MSRSGLILTILGLCLTPIGLLAAISLDGLVRESPFMPKQEGGGSALVVTENAVVEFRGMITTKDGVLFGLYDRGRNQGVWVKQDEAGADFKVRSYDAGNELVTVDYQGQTFTLPLSLSKIGAASPSAAPVVAAPAVGGGPRVVATTAASRGDDQRRLESVAAEVRRRRALRQAAASGTATPAATGGERK
jgi:hypothetical protein